MGAKPDTVKLLLDHGADASAADPDGVTVERVARSNPAMLAMVREKLNKQENKEVVKGAPCHACGKEGAKQRCAMCNLAVYCGKDCQMAHWKQHKAACTEHSAKALRVSVFRSDHIGIIPINQLHGQMLGMGGQCRPKPTVVAAGHVAGPPEGASKPFPIKIQVPLGQAVSRQTPCVIYNRNCSFVCCSDSVELGRLVRQRGINGQKMYLMARFDEEAQGLELAADKLLPAQPW
eukprot:scaffold20.g7767.t1